MIRRYRFCCVAVLLMLFGCSSVREAARKDDGLQQHVVKARKNCWEYADAPTLLSVLREAMQIPLEPDYARDNYIQTFGCAYEEVDIEKNSIQAVYRAIQQSLRNRNVTVRDDLLALLNSRPPRPENLVREYTIYVNMPNGTNGDAVASYQVKILQLEVVQTVESQLSVWTRIATRFRYREDHYRALPLSDEKSEFVKVLEKAQKILQHVENGKMEKVAEALRSYRQNVSQPRGLMDLTFGDRLTLVSEANPSRTYPAVFLGKGILFGLLPKKRTAVFKFGEERLFGMRLNLREIRRTAGEYREFGYHAPETILQCLFLKSSRKSRVRRLDAQKRN